MSLYNPPYAEIAFVVWSSERINIIFGFLVKFFLFASCRFKPDITTIKPIVNVIIRALRDMSKIVF